MLTADEQAVADLIEKVRYLLEWMPICSIGSSGHLRRVDVEQAIAKLLASTRPADPVPDSAIDTSDIPEVKDWSGAEVGKFYRPQNVFNPATIVETDDLGELLRIAHRLRATFGPQYLTSLQKLHRPAKAVQSWGMCYIASEALYHLGAKESGFKPAYLPDPEGKRAGHTLHHWFLVRKVAGHTQILDITADQFSVAGRNKLHKSYADATGCGFLTKKPSKRTRLLIEHMEHFRFRRIVEGRQPLEDMDTGGNEC